MVVALVGMGLLPLGVALALGTALEAAGRCASPPTVFISSCAAAADHRALHGSLMLPCSCPIRGAVDKLLAAGGVALFASAYMAEVVRGGLWRSRGPIRGSMALGLTHWQSG